MNVLLKPELEQFVDEKIRAGQYPDPSAMVNEALEVLREQEAFTPEHEAYLRREVRRGLEQLDRGERAHFTAETIIAQQRRRMAGKKGV
jgi:antitoxin ParD1/3/4